jgi:DNA repair ATPase RecN
VSKDSSLDSSLTSITELDGDSIVQEVARMLGGDDFSDESLAHAQQLVANLN